MNKKTIAKKAAKTEAVKVEEKKIETVAEPVKAEAPVVEEKKAAAKKTAAKKPASKKAAAPKVTLAVEYQGKQVTEETILAAVKEAVKDVAVKTLEIYVKPEDDAVYYVANGDVTGKVAF